MIDQPRATGITPEETVKPKFPNFGTRLLSVFVEPKVVFDYLSVRSDFWRPFITASAITMVITYFTVPITWSIQKDLMLAMGKPLPEQGINPTLIAFLGAVFAPVGLAVALIISAGIVWLLALLMSGSARYPQVLSIMVYSFFPTLLATVIGAVVMLVTNPQFTGMETVLQTLQPVQYYTSLAAVIPSGLFVSKLLSHVSLFTIWGLYLLYIGLVRSIKMKSAQSLTIVVIMLILQLAVASYQAFQLAGGMKGS